MTRVGRLFWALDYKEPVLILAIDRRGRRGRGTRVTIQRANGETTKNYPVYLLDGCGAALPRALLPGQGGGGTR